MSAALCENLVRCAHVSCSLCAPHLHVDSVNVATGVPSFHYIYLNVRVP